jgi:hypothetical protein
VARFVLVALVQHVAPVHAGRFVLVPASGVRGGALGFIPPGTVARVRRGGLRLVPAGEAAIVAREAAIVAGETVVVAGQTVIVVCRARCGQTAVGIGPRQAVPGV